MTNDPHTSLRSSQALEDSSPSAPPRQTVTSFERYSDDIRDAMRIANREAKWHCQPEIGVPHLLIALVREPTGLGGALLRLKGLDAQRLRRAVRASCPRRWIFSLFAKLPLSPDLQALVDKASEHAIVEKHDAVGTGGMLLAMLRYDAIVNRLLADVGLDVPALERMLKKYLHRFMVEAPNQVLYFDAEDAV